MNPLMRSLRQATRAQNAHQVAMTQMNKEIASIVPWADIVLISTPSGIYHVVIGDAMGKLHEMPVTDFMKLIRDGVVSREDFFGNAEVIEQKVAKAFNLVSEKLEGSDD